MVKDTLKIRDNAGKLAATLSVFSDDEVLVGKLSRILKYEPKQLQEAMRDIWEVVRKVPK